MAARPLLSLTDIAHGYGIAYKTAARWLSDVEPEVRANRTLGRPAQYDMHVVSAAVKKYQKRSAKVAA